MRKIDQIHNKIIAPNKLNSLIKKWESEEQKVVFSNGCFDILHLGHVDYLSRAADFGDKLIIGLNSDASVKRIKGENRPINSQEARASLLAALFFVDAVIFFDEDTPYELIKTVQPDILVKGNDYAPKDIVGYDIVTAKGGKVETVELVPGLSTTILIEKMKS